MSVNSEPTRKRLTTTLPLTSQHTSLANTLIEAYDMTLTPSHFYTPILRESDDTVLREAARVGDMDTVVKKLGSLGLCSTDGRTALMEAAMRGHLEIARLCMLEVGATTIPTSKYNLPVIYRDDTNFSWTSESEETTDYLHPNASNFDNFSFYDSRGEFTDNITDFINRLNPANSRPGITTNSIELSESTDDIGAGDSALFHITESMDTPSRVLSESFGASEARPIHNTSTTHTDPASSQSSIESSTSPNTTVSSYSSASNSSSSTSTNSHTISSMNSTVILNKDTTKIDTTFYISSNEDRSLLLSPWSSTYSHCLRRLLTDDEILTTPKSYRQACEYSYFKVASNTALTLAISNHQRNTILLLIDKEIGMAGVTPLMASAIKDDVPGMLRSMEYINARDANRFTALSLATMFGHLKAAELISNEFIDMPDYPTWADPLVIAAKYNFLQHLNLFLEVIPKPITSVISMDRIRMALIEAAKAGHLDFLKILLSTYEHTKSISANVIIAAAEHGHLDCIKYFATTYPKRFTAYADLILISAIKAYKQEVVEFICENFVIGTWPRPSPLFFAAISSNRYILDLVRRSSKIRDGITPLMIAAATGDAVGLVQHIGDARKRDIHGLTALMYAALAGHVEDPLIYKDLVKLEAGLNCVGGLFAIAHAIKTNNLGLMEQLLDYEAIMTFSNDLSILDVAIAHGSSEAILRIVEYISFKKLPIFVKRRQISNYSQCSSPLLEAVEDFDNDGVRKYLYQANHCTDLWSPLQKAVYVRNHEAVKLLLCELGYVNTMGYTALLYAITENNIEAAQLLLPEINCIRYNERTCLMVAASLGFVELVKLLIPYEAGKVASNGDTALMYAAIEGHQDCVRLLLPYESGLISNDGSSALMCAAGNKSIDCVRLLLEKEKMMISHKGYSALALSMQENCLEAATMLYRYEKDISKITDLMWGAFINDIDAIHKHIDQAGIQSATQATALMYAATANNVRVVETLLPYEKQLVDDTGHSALMYAIEAKALDCVKVLLPYESNIKTFKEKDVIDIAKSTKSQEIINVVKAHMDNIEHVTNRR
ncbi:Protein 21.1 [Giardia lamblia P15]|uniref:Protein 21.1 n=1 Tax=Giardia intestinalis (strain P15) TaxID=658858 RepID=E1F1Z8_GIAIA|nr:Protein 21.1 [Giardia lamblia P15]